MESESNNLSTLNLILQARLLLEIILHPTSCMAVLHNWHAFYATKMPEKLMYFTSTGWVDLPSEVLETIKGCFKCKTMATKVNIEGVQVVANLLGMVVVDSSGRMCSIAWIDSDGKIFFPSKIFGGGIGRVREVSGVIRPAFASLEDLKRLEESSVEYGKVRCSFLKGMRGFDQETKVSDVYSCTHASAFGNSRLKAFERMEEITKRNGNKTSSRYGWYGAEPKRVEAIVVGGFGLEDAICGVYGVGIYFSPRDYLGLSACYSTPDANGEYHMLLCQIIMGRVEKITPGSKQYTPSTKEFDNAIDDFKNRRRFIIWTANMSTHIIPRFIVSFKVSQLTQERWRRFQYERNSRLQRLPIPIPLRCPQTSLPRRPQYLERYNRNKNRLP